MQTELFFMMRSITLTFLLFFLNFIFLFSQNLPKADSGNSLEAFQGQLAGLKITPGKGVGSSPNVLVRGVNTWNNNDPIKAGNIMASANKNIHNKVLKILKPISK